MIVEIDDMVIDYLRRIDRTNQAPNKFKGPIRKFIQKVDEPKPEQMDPVSVGRFVDHNDRMEELGTEEDTDESEPDE